MPKMRSESDSLGAVKVSFGARYGRPAMVARARSFRGFLN